MRSVHAQEHELVESARSGDPDAWEQLYRRAYPRLFAYARRRLATEEQAEEAVSETMVRAMDKIGGYQHGTVGIDGWFFGIARNIVRETYRAGARQRPTDPSVLVAADTRTAPDPASALVEAEDRRQVAAAFSRLSDADRDLLELRVVGGLDAAAVAALTDRRPGAVRTAQSRALQRLRAEYEGLMA